jgi:hypothetical protein
MMAFIDEIHKKLLGDIDRFVEISGQALTGLGG